MSTSTPLAVVCALIEREGLVLVAQRPAHKHLGGKWEFPGGKIEPGETAEAALHRELNEELGCTVEILRPLAPHTHAYQNVTINLIPFIVRLQRHSSEPTSREHTALRWVAADQLSALDLPAADLPVITEYLNVQAHHGDRHP